MRYSSSFAVAGFTLLLPSCVLVSSGLLGFHVAPGVIHPVAVMGGLLTALALNVLSVLQVRGEREQQGHVAAVTVRIANKGLNLAVIAMSILLLATILGYLFVENFQPR